jgi:hypothetical protein
MPPLTTYIWYIVKKSTKGYNSVEFGCRKKSFLSDSAELHLSRMNGNVTNTLGLQILFEDME